MLFNEMIRPQSKVSPHIDYGLGWMIVKDLPKEEYALVHSGSDIGVRAVIILLPKSGKGLVILTNGDNGQKLIQKLIMKTIDCGKTIIEYFNY